MAKLNRHEVIQLLSKSASVPPRQVEQLLVSVARLAAEHLSDGFLLPELGEFVLAPGPEIEFRNPLNGETMTLPGKPMVQFIPDDAILEKMIATEPTSGDLPSEPATVLPEIRLHPDASDWQTAQKDEDLYDSAVHKLGGTPDWIQDDTVPKCCARDMTFYGQFDSRVCGKFNVMDAAVILVFVCDHCSKPRAIAQSY